MIASIVTSSLSNVRFLHMTGRSFSGRDTKCTCTIQMEMAALKIECLSKLSREQAGNTLDECAADADTFQLQFYSPDLTSPQQQPSDRHGQPVSLHCQ